ncbi:MAG: xanthine dehydrogenase family protein subunit M [Proteobacteria bacterium]|nr:xanthine dehydrogenase family protein subunit M [Pseudomonadota bacterium]MDA1332381.1 xanthine dehydrogenase family protein subunit M [Pseudomonadota bacterium]
MKYVTPKSASEASQALLQEGAFALAGGTDLLVKLKTRFVSPKVVVDIKYVPKIMAIEQSAQGWWIGAATPCAEIVEHNSLSKDWPGVVEALSLIGSTQIQGRATLGGNLCNASPAADSVPALIAAGATCVISGQTKEREEPVEKIVTAPGRTALDKGEFIIGFKLPKPRSRAGDAYLRLIPRSEMDIAVVGAGVSLSVSEDGRIEAIRVALGAIAPTQVLLSGLEDIFVGKEPNDDAIQKLVSLAEKACKPIKDKRGTIEYRTKIAGVLAKRAFGIALKRATNS